jgi:hypothetical protein
MNTETATKQLTVEAVARGLLDLLDGKYLSDKLVSGKKIYGTAVSVAVWYETRDDYTVLAHFGPYSTGSHFLVMRAATLAEAEEKAIAAIAKLPTEDPTKPDPAAVAMDALQSVRQFLGSHAIDDAGHDAGHEAARLLSVVDGALAKASAS